jgi:hypothetical protein
MKLFADSARTTHLTIIVKFDTASSPDPRERGKTDTAGADTGYAWHSQEIFHNYHYEMNIRTPETRS